MHRGLIALVALPLLLAGCGQSVILPKPTEQVVTKFVAQRTGFRPHDVSCPSGVPAKAGKTFQCHFTGPDGKYIVYMKVIRVNGTRVDYQIRSERVGHKFDAAAAERIVAAFVARRTGFHPRDVTCPAGTIPLVGHTIVCHFTGPDGTYTASILITAANRGLINYRITTRRTG
jgi:hypothetical protein